MSIDRTFFSNLFSAKGRMKSIVLALGQLFFCMGMTAFAQENVFPQGPERELTSTDFFRYAQDDIKYNEIWRYNFVFNNGTKVFLNYSIMSVPFFGTNCGINISFYNFREKNYQVGREYPEDRFVEIKGGSAGIHIRTGSENNIFYMEGLPEDGHHVVFKTLKNEGFLLDLRFCNPLLGKIIGDGVFNLGQQKAGLYVHIPEGQVKGLIGIGKDIIKVEGFGYMDHLRQTKQPMELATCSLLLYGKDAPFTGNIIVGSEKYGAIPYGYLIDKKTQKILFPKEIKSGNKTILNELESLSEIEITWRNDPRITMIRSHMEHQRFSFLSTMEDWFSKQAAKFFMGGEVISLRGILHVNLYPTHYSILYVK